MSSQRPFRIIIAGGGIAGLTIATMCEKLGLSYVLLEAHDDICPPVGASIGLFPNGFYILDQLGCYDAIHKASDGVRYDGYSLMDQNGRQTSSMPQIQYHQKIRHGYSMAFFDRQMLLKVLYDNLQDKSPIMLNRSVSRVVHADDGVEVVTLGGESFSGDVVIGADGIHSKVRHEMRRIAEVASPSYFDKDEEEMAPCYYQCSFGIAQDVPNWRCTDLCSTSGRGNSKLVVSGPDNKVYWFIFVRLPEVARGKQIPRYSEEDEAQFVKKYAHLKITERVTFGQVYARRLRNQSTLTPLHEVVYKKWFYGRMMTIGDSAHKTNPISGYGGNAAIESAAELMNQLLDLRDRRGGRLDGATTDEIHRAFERVQKERHSSAEVFVKKAHDSQAIVAWEKPWLSFLFSKILIRVLGRQTILRPELHHYVRGVRLRHLPPPQDIPHIVPYDHELRSKPVGKATFYLVWAVFAVVMGLLVYTTSNVMQFWKANSQGWVRSTPIMPDAPWLGSQISRYTINLPTTSLPLASELGNTDTATLNVQIFYTLAQTLAPLSIFTIEGNRLGRSGGLISLPLLYSIAVQMRSAFEIVPIWTLISLLSSDQLTVDRPVDVDAAEALLPALLTSLAVAALTSTSSSGFFGFAQQGVWQTWIPVSAILFSVLTPTLALARKIRRRYIEGEVPTDKNEEWYSTRDVPFLKLIYDLVFVLLGAAHVAAVAYVFSSSTTSFSRILFTSLTNADADIAIMSYGILATVAGMLGQNLFAIWQLRQIGYVSTWSALKAAAAVLVGQVVVGPGATWARLWRWREEVYMGMRNLSGEVVVS